MTSTIFIKIYEMIAAILFALMLLSSTRQDVYSWSFWFWFVLALFSGFMVIYFETGCQVAEATGRYDKEFEEMKDKINELESKLKEYER